MQKYSQVPEHFIHVLIENVSKLVHSPWIMMLHYDAIGNLRKKSQLGSRVVHGVMYRHVKAHTVKTWHQIFLGLHV